MNPVAKKRSLACYSRNRPVTEPLFVPVEYIEVEHEQ